jgi:hypothetical protein
MDDDCQSPSGLRFEFVASNDPPESGRPNSSQQSAFRRGNQILEFRRDLPDNHTCRPPNGALGAVIRAT